MSKRSARSNTKPRRPRLQFDCKAADLRLIDEIKRRSGLSKHGDAVRIGLRLLDRLLRAKEEGCVLILKKERTPDTALELLW